MNKSESIVHLAEALSAAQAEMPAVKFNSTNPFLKSRYADLGAIVDTAKPILAKLGLSVPQLTYSESGEIGVETVLLHKSGEWISSRVGLSLETEKGKSAAQVAGSTITYLRRYGYASILGMFADEDTDGHGLSTSGIARPSIKTAIEPVSEPPEEPIDEKVEEPKPVKNENGKLTRPMSPEILKGALVRRASASRPASEKQAALVKLLWLEHFGDSEYERRLTQEFLTGKKHFGEIEPSMLAALLDWMKPEQSLDGSGSYIMSQMAKQELRMVAQQFVVESGRRILR